MKYLLDTNVCADYLNGRHPPVVERIQAHEATEGLAAARKVFERTGMLIAQATARARRGTHR